MKLKEALYGVGSIECPVTYNENVRRAELPVILLHGFNFNRRVWIETGIAGILDAKGIPSLMPDMPYGRKTACTKRTRNIDVNVKAVREVSNIVPGRRPPIIVGASIGGRVALYYAARYPVKGLLLASPAVKDDEEIWEYIKLIRSPVVILRGARDFIPLRIHRKLAEKLRARLVVYEGAGHAMYLSDPERFASDVEGFYRSLVNNG
ncbi:MAG: alpha/beta hydrolase [Desulfurococcales archaeon]|nr:alpha/beta hydrolase [Desulfurococcales archaeon]